MWRTCACRNIWWKMSGFAAFTVWITSPVRGRSGSFSDSSFSAVPVGDVVDLGGL